MDTANPSPQDQPGYQTTSSDAVPTDVAKIEKTQISSSTGQEVSPGSNQPTANTHPPYKLLDESRILRQFRSPCGIDALSPTKDGGASWTKFSNTATLINTEGRILQEIKYQVWISDVRVSPITNNVWACSREDCSIMECMPRKTPVVRFNTDLIPHCICLANDGCIFVGMSKQITKFDTEGKVLNTSSSKDGRPLVCTPRRISQCGVTQNVAVVDRDGSKDGGEDKPRVLVMDKDFKELFQFRDNLADVIQSTSERPLQPFEPRDVKYDSKGNIVISDSDNGSLHLLSGSGEYLRLLHRDSDWVWCIGIDPRNVLWARFGVFGRDAVRLFQYYV